MISLSKVTQYVFRKYTWLCRDLLLHTVSEDLGDVFNNSQGCFTGTRATVWLSQSLWGNPEGFICTHDDVIKWKHFPRYWPFVRGIHRCPVNSPHKGQWRGALMLSVICALNKRLSKQSWGWRCETPSRSLWRRCNGNHNKAQQIVNNEQNPCDVCVCGPPHVSLPSYANKLILICICDSNAVWHEIYHSNIWSPGLYGFHRESNYIVASLILHAQTNLELSVSLKTCYNLSWE